MRKLNVPRVKAKPTEAEIAESEGWVHESFEVEQEVVSATWNVYVHERRISHHISVPSEDGQRAYYGHYDAKPVYEHRKRLARVITWNDLMQERGLQEELERLKGLGHGQRNFRIR